MLLLRVGGKDRPVADGEGRGGGTEGSGEERILFLQKRSERKLVVDRVRSRGTDHHLGPVAMHYWALHPCRIRAVTPPVPCCPNSRAEPGHDHQIPVSEVFHLAGVGDDLRTSVRWLRLVTMFVAWRRKSRSLSAFSPYIRVRGLS